MMALRAAASFAASTALTAGTGMSRFRSRTMTWAAGI
jgi:hypothetical protein